MQGKSELTQELMAKKEAVNVELDIRRPENRPLLIFYNNRVDASLKEIFDRCAGQTEQTLKQF
ncbi:hypothetical protein [uncultured Alistipes sp.]|uniref:hypothetical protein n=1 Tax=uncultured Alistipes sp. TaxID=538949 RepID=UPI0025EF7588|nr:hypothetical protein [uncultured Alistipes sp.]